MILTLGGTNHDTWFLVDPVAKTAQTLPLNGPANATGLKPFFGKLAQRHIACASFSRPIVYTEFGGLYPAGITAPAAPTLAKGSGSGGIIGQTFGYVAFRQRTPDGSMIIQESNPSLPSNAIANNGEGRVWTGIPTTTPDTRVTHVVGYLSQNGQLAGQAWETTLGISTITENQAAAALLPTLLALPPDALGNVFPNVTGRGVPPFTLFAEPYNFAMAYAGDPNHPERIYLSLANEPESVDSVSTRGFLSTIGGEPVTALRRWQNVLMVGTNRGWYAITGYSFVDYEINLVNQYYGCVSGAACIRVGANGDLWFPSAEGMVMYNGAFRYIMGDMWTKWRTDYKANRAGFESSIAVQDREHRGYKLLVPTATGYQYWYGHYEPVSRGLQPKWFFDQRTRTDTTCATMIDPTSIFGEIVVTGSSDGFIRQENIDTDGTDDGDTNKKHITIRGKHLFLGDQGGDDAHAYKVTDIDLYLATENQATTVSGYAGDDDAASAGTPQFQQVIAKTATTDTKTGKPKVKKTSLTLNPSQLSGKGVTLGLDVDNPVGWQLRGWAVNVVEGVQERPST